MDIPLSDVNSRKFDYSNKTLERKEVFYKNLGIYDIATFIGEGESYTKNTDLEFLILKGFLVDEKGTQVLKDGKPVYIDLRFKDTSVKGGRNFNLDTFPQIFDIAKEVKTNGKLYIVDVPVFYTKTEKVLEDNSKKIYHNHYINPSTFEDSRFKKVALKDKINPASKSA